MSVVGLITEYNPFHNGHLYHIQKAKEISGADTVVVIMSGNFVQRGTPAMIDKYTRTKMALSAGADLVFELPVCYATASAESFALGAISILHRLGFVDSLVFGSECGDLSLLYEIAKLLENEPASLTGKILDQIKTGMNYPVARAKALTDYLKESKDIDKEEEENLIQTLNSPNNILGIEYLRALIRLKSTITPYTIQRIQAEFHEQKLEGNINSATAIRKSLIDNKSSAKPDPLVTIKDSVPYLVFSILQDMYGKTFPIHEDQLSLLLKYELLSQTKESLIQFLDVSSDLANRITNNKYTSHSFSQLVTHVRTKQYTQVRIQRALLHILLKIRKEDCVNYITDGITPYARILGFRKTASAYLKQSEKEDSIKIIGKLSKAELTGSARQMLDQDIYATHLYNLLVAEQYSYEMKDEYTTGMIIVN